MTNVRCWGVLATLSMLALAGVAKAESVAVFMVGKDDPLKLVEQVKRELVRSASGTLAQPHAWRAEPLSDDTFRRAGRELAKTLIYDDDLNRNKLTERYGPTIAEGMFRVSSATDPVSRSWLWGLCLLNVQLHMMTERNAAQAAEDCRRRFPEQDTFSDFWSYEVVQAVQSVALDTAAIDISSAHGKCEILLFGATFGATPARFEVAKGYQEISLRCGSRSSKVHELEVTSPRALTVSLDADEALVGHRLEYKDPQIAERAREHAALFAEEAKADSFVVIQPQAASGAGWILQRIRTADDRVLAQARVAGDATRAQIEQAARALFDLGHGVRGSF